MTVLLTLPTPPSVNGMFRNVRGVGRVKTTDYKAWLTEAGWALKTQKPQSIEGAFGVTLVLPRLPPGSDIDNRAKATLDLLVTHGVVADDKLCRRLLIERDDTASLAVVTVEPWGQA